MRHYEYIDLSQKRKVFAVGDIHGCFSKLEEKLIEVGFNKEIDALVSTGDLVDRGPENILAKEYCKQPWFYRVIGNHELLVNENVSYGEVRTHMINGGAWITYLPYEEQVIHRDILLDAPLLLEVLTPGKLNVGFVHADLTYNNWVDNQEKVDLSTFCWERRGAKKLIDPTYEPVISGIDKVFFGHNAFYKPQIRGNCRWIDTGSGFVDGFLTVVDVDIF